LLGEGGSQALRLGVGPGENRSCGDDSDGERACHGQSRHARRREESTEAVPGDLKKRAVNDLDALAELELGEEIFELFLRRLLVAFETEKF
jgi:hypothetical protein